MKSCMTAGRQEFKSSPVEGSRRSLEAGPGDRAQAPPSFIVKALDVVSGCANPLESTVRSLRHYAVRMPDEIPWAAAALGIPEADPVVSTTPARLEEAQNTACLGRNHADMCSHLALAAASGSSERIPSRLRRNLVPESRRLHRAEA